MATPMPPISAPSPTDPIFEPGPYGTVETKTFKLTGPIEITLTRRFDSTHVPPVLPCCACGGDPGATAAPDTRMADLMSMLQPLGEAILAKLAEIKAQQARQP